MILIRDLNKYYRSSKLEFHALKNININIEKGEFVSIVGKSGSGKSTKQSDKAYHDAFMSAYNKTN